MSDDFEDIIRGFREEREASGANSDDDLLGPPPQVTALLVVPVREAPMLASVLKAMGGQGTAVGTDRGVVVSLGEASSLTVPEAAAQLSGMLPGVDLLALTKQGGLQEEGQVSCERYRDGSMVDRPIVALVIDALPEQARTVMLRGGDLSKDQGAIDIGSSPDPPSGDPVALGSVPTPGAARAMGVFDIFLSCLVGLGAVLLLIQGLFAEGGVSWPRVVFGALALAWCVWRFTPAGRARMRPTR